ncbi:tether containing UBX domain for GLUT4 isoform X2 [Dendropsophus ebraccatus]
MVSRSEQRAGAESTKVRVALQLEGAARLQDEFLSSQSLWEVLTHFSQTRECLEDIAPGSIAVCIYMRDEVSGEQALKQTNLQSLGLTSGSAIIRFIVRKNEPSENRQPKILQEETKKKDTYVDVTELPSTSAIEKPSAASQKVQHSSDSTKLDESSVQNPVQDSGPSLAERQDQHHVKVVRPDLECDKPGPSSRDLSEASTQPQVTSFMPFQGGGHRLGGANVPTEANMLTATAQEPSHSPGPSRPKKSKTDGEESTSGPIDRETLVCHLDLEESASASLQELPDDFFEVTMDDVRRRFAELRSERKRLEEAPLMTKALREAQLKEKIERYPKIVLRVLFPDRYILQGFFRISETIGAVREFVSNHLEEPEIPFYLFITPPRTELKDDSLSLFQAQLFPAAVIHFGSPKQKEHFLRQNLVNEPMSPSQADIIVARAMPHVPVMSSAPVIDDHSEARAVAANRAPEDYEEQVGISDPQQQPQRDQGKVPKWLKLPGKK